MDKKWRKRKKPKANCLKTVINQFIKLYLKDDDVKVLHSICQQIWKTKQWPQDWKRSVFIPIPKKSRARILSLHMLAK